MSVDEVVDVVLSYLKAILSWPGVVLLAVLIFRKQIAELIRRVKSLRPTEVLFRDVKKTAVDARAAKKKAQADARRAARARRAESRAERRSGESHGLATAGGPINDVHGRDEAAATIVPLDHIYVKEDKSRAREAFISKLEEEFTNRELHLANRGKPRAETVHSVSMAWRDLESTILLAARTLGLRSNDPRLGGAASWTPVEFFTELLRDGRGSRAALRAAHNAQSLIDQMRLGSSIDFDEAKALEEAINDLKETVRKIVAINNGKKLVQSFLKQSGSTTLPDSDE